MSQITQKDVDALLDSQLAVWEQAHNNYAALANVRTRHFDIDGAAFSVQFNPARIVSTAAKVDAKSITARKCFLCEENRPQVQEGILWNNKYTILINPFPIFTKHLTIPCTDHTCQKIAGRITDMLALARLLPDYTLFYNGAKCGASAPDHMHFQAGNKGFMHIESDIEKWDKTELASCGGSTLYQMDSPLYSFYLISGDSDSDSESLFGKVLAALPTDADSGEPMLNLLAYHDNATGKDNLIVVPRRKHRPDCYFAEGDACMLISPASVDMGGVFITPRIEDFERIAASDIKGIFAEVCYNKVQLGEVSTKIE